MINQHIFYILQKVKKTNLVSSDLDIESVKQSFWEEKFICCDQTLSEIHFFSYGIFKNFSSTDYS